MAILTTRHQTDLEKRLSLLRRQVYGKEFRIKDNKNAANYGLRTINSSSDITYLHHDLLKILIFAGVAIGVQIILYFLNFF